MQSAYKILVLEKVMEEELPWLEQYDVPIIANVAGSLKRKIMWKWHVEFRKHQM